MDYSDGLDLYTAISICTGVGMLDHGVNLALGGALRPLMYVEREAFCCANLAWQMEKKFLVEAPIWDDVKSLTSLDCHSYVREVIGKRNVDILFGGIPCQPWSQAGKKLGDKDERDLWPATLKAIKEYKPNIVFIENVGGILSKEQGGKRIITDLQGNSYTATAGLFSSAEVGASHRRERCFFMGYRNFDRFDESSISKTEKWNDHPMPAGTINELADSQKQYECRITHSEDGQGESIGRCGSNMGYSSRQGLERGEKKGNSRRETIQMSKRRSRLLECRHYAPARNDYRSWAVIAKVEPSRMPCVESGVRGMAHGMAARADKLRSIGNGVDPLVAAYAFVTLWACLQEREKQ